MAVPAGTHQVHDAIGVREDLANIIYDISPMDTPLMSNIGRGSASQPLTEWQTDALAAASASNAQIEGDDANTDTATPTLRFNNYCQIASKVPRVSGTLQASDTAGRANELSYQIAKRGRELKRDIEMTLAGTQVATAGAGASARVCAGLAGWMYTNHISVGANGTVPPLTNGGHPSAAMTMGTNGAITEDRLKTAIALCWPAGGDPPLILMDDANKQIASSFTGVATQYRDNPQKGPATIIGAADVYVSDFGTHSMVASRFVPTDIAYVLDPEFLEVRYLRPIHKEDLAKTGDSDRCMLLAEFTLCNKEPDAHSLIHATS